MDIVERIEKGELLLQVRELTEEKLPGTVHPEKQQDHDELMRLAKFGLEAEKRIKQLLESKYYQKDVPEPLQYLFCYYEFLKNQEAE